MGERIGAIFLFCFLLAGILGSIPLVLGNVTWGIVLLMVGYIGGIIPGIVAVTISDQGLEIGIIGGGTFGLLLGILYFYIIGFIGTGLGDTHHSVSSFLVSLGMGVTGGLIIGVVIGIILKLIPIL